MTSEDKALTFDGMHQTVAEGKKEPSLPVLPNIPQELSANTGETTTFSPSSHDLTAANPERVAILCLKEAGIGTYTFSVKPDLQVVDIKSYPIPPLNLIDHLGGGMAIKARDKFLDEVYDASEMCKLLRTWLRRLYKQQKNSERWMIIIEDNLGIPFPWEFFAFKDPDDQDGRVRHMGAEFRVTRWQDLNYDDDDDDDDDDTIINNDDDESYNDESDDCSNRDHDDRDLSPLARSPLVKGNILAYFSSDIQARERPVLTRLKANILTDVEGFKTALLKSEKGVGLVYVGCYTVLGDHLKRDWIKIGHMKDMRQQISLRKLRFRSGHGRLLLKRIQCSKPVVFLNACFTAQTRRYEAEISQVATSFPKVFLENDASGVIATLGLVDDTHFAPQIAEAIINAVKDRVEIAEALRRARSSAFEALPKGRDVTHDELKEFFNAFMYIYYGNPRTILDVSGS